MSKISQLLILVIVVVAFLVLPAQSRILAQGTEHNESDETQEDLHAAFGEPIASLVFPDDPKVWTIAYANRIYAYLYDTYLVWDDANSYCRNAGGELVSVLSRNHQEAIEKLLKKPRKIAEKGIVWTAGRFTNCAHRWTFPNSYQPIIHETEHDIDHDYLYTNWHKGTGIDEPDLECIGISNDPQSSFGKWKTEECDAHVHSFICQFDPCQSLSHTAKCARAERCILDPNHEGNCIRVKRRRSISFVAPGVPQ
jgi:hypothetical protein